MQKILKNNPPGMPTTDFRVCRQVGSGRVASRRAGLLSVDGWDAGRGHCLNGKDAADKDATVEQAVMPPRHKNKSRSTPWSKEHRGSMAHRLPRRSHRAPRRGPRRTWHRRRGCLLHGGVKPIKACQIARTRRRSSFAFSATASAPYSLVSSTAARRSHSAAAHVHTNARTSAVPT